MINWDKPLVRTQCDTDQECINKAWYLLKIAIEKDTKQRMTQKLLQKLTEEEHKWLKDHILEKEKEEINEKNRN